MEVRMIDLIRDQREAIDTICRRYRVKTLEVFGSAATGLWDPMRSDLDFLVQFHPLGPGGLFDFYFDLKNDLEDLFGRNVDLVSARGIRNPYFLESVNRSRQVLNAA
jgi:predicted nucleotidyltransferase